MLTDGRGVPLGVEANGAITRELQLLQGKFNSKPIRHQLPCFRAAYSITPAMQMHYPGFSLLDHWYYV